MYINTRLWLGHKNLHLASCELAALEVSFLVARRTERRHDNFGRVSGFVLCPSVGRQLQQERYPKTSIVVSTGLAHKTLTRHMVMLHQHLVHHEGSYYSQATSRKRGRNWNSV